MRMILNSREQFSGIHIWYAFYWCARGSKLCSCAWFPKRSFNTLKDFWASTMPDCHVLPLISTDLPESLRGQLYDFRWFLHLKKNLVPSSKLPDPNKCDVLDVSKELWKCCALVSGMVVNPLWRWPLVGASPQDPDIGLEKSVLAIPPLLAVGAVHHYLIQQGLRSMSFEDNSFIDVYWAFGIKQKRFGVPAWCWSKVLALEIIWHPSCESRRNKEEVPQGVSAASQALKHPWWWARANAGAHIILLAWLVAGTCSWKHWHWLL